MENGVSSRTTENRLTSSYVNLESRNEKFIRAMSAADVLEEELLSKSSDSYSVLGSDENFSDLDADDMANFQDKRRDKNFSWDRLSFWDKASLFNKWSLISLVGSICTIFGSFTYLFPWGFQLKATEFNLGLGCALNWISLTRYLTYTREYSLITRTLQAAVPINLRIMVGILPIFFGYALFCMSVFWSYTSHFSNFSDTAYCLFSMMNGDSILITFQSTTPQYNLLSMFTFYSFTFMAICIWQNMNFVIVEDSYLNVKYQNAYSWLFGDDHDHEDG